MCGRLVLTSSFTERIKAIFAGLTSDEWFVPRYNVTPGQVVPALKSFHPPGLEWIAWGFPSKAESAKEHNNRLMINARAETVNKLPSFRDSFLKNRCIILADGFFEWNRNSGPAKPQPYYFEMKDHGPFALAGLWTRKDAHDTENQGREGCLVITTEANSIMHPIHHRMPAILTPESAALWLNHDTNPETLHAMLQPFPSGLMSTHPVSDRVNKAGNEGPELITPVKIFEQTSMF
jgi:putative SOS response-associated peptidase YedK